MNRSQNDPLHADLLLDPVPEGSGDGKNPLHKVHGLLRGRYVWASIVAAVLGLAGAAVGYTSTKPEWTSRGIIRINPVIQSPLNDDNSSIPDFDQFIETQVHVLTSQRLMQFAMKNDAWKAAPQKPARTLLDFTNGLQANHPRNSQLIDVTFTDKDPALATTAVKVVLLEYRRLFAELYPDHVTAQFQQLADMRKQASDEITGDQNEITLLCSKYSLSGVVNDLEVTYQQRVTEVNQMTENVENLDLQYGPVLKTVSASTQPASTMPATTMAAGGAGATSQPAVKADASIELTPQLVAMTDTRMAQLLEQQEAQDDLYRTYSRQYGPNSQPMVALQAQRDTTNEDIAKRLAEAKKQPELGPGGATMPAGTISVREVAERLARMHEVLATKKQNMQDMGDVVKRVGELKHKIADATTDLEAVDRRRKQLMTQASNTGHLEVIGDSNGSGGAEQPLEPTKDRRLAMAGGFGFGGLAIGFGIFALIGLLDRRLHSIADARDTIDRSNRILGILPALPENITDPEQTAAVAFSVHHIRTLLQLSGNGKRSTVFAVTSAAPQDGKTSLVLSLGLSYAASGAKTLLIDSDVIGAGLSTRLAASAHMRIGGLLQRSGKITAAQLEQALSESKRTGCKVGEALMAMGLIQRAELERGLAAQGASNTGLLDILDGMPLADCITSAGAENLSVLPVGNISMNHVGQLSVDVVKKLIAEARKQFDIVIFDTGPLLGSLEGGIVAAAVDEVVVAVSRGQHRPLLEKTFRRLKELGAKIGGVVFNRARLQDIERSGYSSSMASQRHLPAANGTAAGTNGSRRLGPIAQALSGNEARKQEGAP